MLPSRTRMTRPRLTALLAGAAALALLSGCAATAAPTKDDSAAPAVKADASLFSTLPDAIQKSKTIRIGTEAQYAPYEYIDKDGSTISGLDPDLVNAIADRLGVKITLTNTAFDGLLPALDGNRFDMLAAGFTDTKAREAQYDFVNYFRSGQAIVVKKGNPEKLTTMADLCGQPVSVLKASVQETMLGDLNAAECASNKVEIVSLPDNQTAFLQIQSGRVKALLVQDPVARYNIAQQGDGAVFEVGNPELISPSVIGFMFTKDATELRDAVQGALQSLIDDGTYQDILEARKLGNGAVESATLNGGLA
jgi:polar amino acid transport system substrate-binding protein